MWLQAASKTAFVTIAPITVVSGKACSNKRLVCIFLKAAWMMPRSSSPWLDNMSRFSLPKYGCIHFTSFTYTCHWHEHSIASFMPAVWLLRLHCLIATSCIMTQIALPCCYHTTHYLATRTCFPIYKDPVPEEESLKLILLYLQAEYSCASQSPCLSATGVLLNLASEQLHWWPCSVGLVSSLVINLLCV